jgi:hypothetical protein
MVRVGGGIILMELGAHEGAHLQRRSPDDGTGLRSLSDIAVRHEAREGTGRCAAAGHEKQEAYSLEYVEDFSGPRTKQMLGHPSL